MLEIDRYALARRARSCRHERARRTTSATSSIRSSRKLQMFCSEDLGGFYLDVLKDRLYTTRRRSRARAARRRPRSGTSRTRCCAGWRRILSFTAEEAWKVFAARTTRHRSSSRPSTRCPQRRTTTRCSRKWTRIARRARRRERRSSRTLRAAGRIGSSLQAEVDDHAPSGARLRRCSPASATTCVRADHLGGDASQVAATRDEAIVVDAVAAHPKCERCWHYRADVGADAEHPTICGRCLSNLFGAGETRSAA